MLTPVAMSVVITAVQDTLSAPGPSLFAGPTIRLRAAFSLPAEVKSSGLAEGDGGRGARDGGRVTRDGGRALVPL
jgi:hypothetical protein